MNHLLDHLIRIGSQHPDLQKHLEPILDRMSSRWEPDHVTEPNVPNVTEPLERFIRDDLGYKVQDPEMQWEEANPNPSRGEKGYDSKWVAKLKGYQRSKGTSNGPPANSCKMGM